MKPKCLLIVLSLTCLFCYVSYAVNPACECVVFESYGRSEGTFQSPNFPSIYPSNINCILYTFIGDLDEIVELSFYEFDLQTPTTSKCVDYVKFFLDQERPEVSEVHPWNYDMCGNISMIQKKHYSSTRSLILEFHTDAVQANNTGFRGKFRFIEKEQFEIKGGNRRWGTVCTYDFYSRDTTKSGRVFSPRYPQNYPPGVNCQYVFFGMYNERVKVVFQNIQLEYMDGSCSDSSDFIVVRDGMDAAKSNVIGQYCNTINDVSVQSTGEHLYIEFIVNDRKQRQGFAATFEFIKEDPPVIYPTPTKSPVYIQPGPVIPREPNIGNNKPDPLDEKGTNTNSPGDDPLGIESEHPTPPIFTTDCVHSFVSNQRKNGSFSSPQYPAPYPNDITCKYVFSGSGRERVQIKFVDLDLNYPAGDPHDPYDCEDTDSITVRVKINGENKEIGVYCGKKRPPTIMSSGNDMEVFFTSKTSSTTKGFNATFNFVEDFGIKTGKQDNSLVCGFEYYSDVSPNGTFTSPNYPGLYPRNTECHYLFFGRSTEKNERVSITFAYFDVEGIAPACLEDNQSDYVEFSNFNVEDRKMRRLCGSGIDKAMRMVESDGNFFRVTFKSNEVYDAMGFEAYYQFKQVQDPFDPSPGRRNGPVNSSPPPAVMSQSFSFLILIITSLRTIL